MAIKAKAFPGHCPVCGGTKKAGKTTFTVDLGFGVVVVRDVPATVCSQCGADWIDDATSAKLEEIVNDARKKHHIVEVTTLSA
jgi:YgiT-type zinc finger domain-containing protein